MKNTYVNTLSKSPFAFFLFKTSDTTYEIINKIIRFWQFRIFIAIYIGYAACYIGKRSFSGVVKWVIEDTESGLNSVEGVGSITSSMAIGYSLGKIVCTLFLDSFPPDKVFPVIILLIGILNFVFAHCHSLYLLILLWGINGTLQGISWSPCAQLLISWYPMEERGRWWGVISTCSSLSSGLSQIGFPYLCTIVNNEWRSAMFFASFFPIFVSIFAMVMIKPSSSLFNFSFVNFIQTNNQMGKSFPIPPSVDMKKIIEKHEEFPATSTENSSHENHKKSNPNINNNNNINNSSDQLSLSTRLKLTLFDRNIQLISISSLLIYIIRTAMNDWMSLFLTNTKNFTPIAAGNSLFWLEIGGAIGITFSGWISDKIYLGRRAPINVIYSFLIALITPFLFFAHSLLANTFFCALFGFFLYGPQTFLGMHVAELANKKASATAIGYNGLLSGVGSIIAGYPVSVVISHLGWESFFILIFISSIVTALLLLPLWSISTIPPPKIQKI